jgi:hypothetical protein
VRARGAEVLASAPRLTTTTADPRLLPFPQLRAAARGEAALPVGWRVSHSWRLAPPPRRMKMGGGPSLVATSAPPWCQEPAS